MGRKPLIVVAWRANRAYPLLLLLLLGLNFAFYGYLTTILEPRVEGFKGSLFERQNFLRRLEQNAVQVGESPQISYRKNLSDYGQFQELVPSKTQFTGLIADLFSLAEEAGLEIQRVAYDPKELTDQYILSYTLSFSVSGAYGDIKKFIYLVEHSSRLFILDDLSLSGSGQGEEGTVSLRLRMTTYFRTDPS